MFALQSAMDHVEKKADGTINQQVALLKFITLLHRLLVRNMPSMIAIL